MAERGDGLWMVRPEKFTRLGVGTKLPQETARWPAALHSPLSGLRRRLILRQINCSEIRGHLSYDKLESMVAAAALVLQLSAFGDTRRITSFARESFF